MGQNAGSRAFTAGEALLEKRRVKIKSGTTTTPPEVEYADAGEQHIGITEADCASGGVVAVKLRTESGSCEGVAAEALAKGATLYGANDGKIQDTSSGSAIGVALEAATADGDVIEWVQFAVLSTTAATVSVADVGGFTTETDVEAALAEIYQDALTAQATITVPLTALHYEDGTIYTKQATTVAGFAQLANKELVLAIPIDCSAGDAAAFSVSIPQDLDDAADITVHVLVGKDADNDALTLDCEVFPCAAGDVANADIQDTAAQAIVAAVTELVFTCGADGVLAAPGALSVVLTQGGTNDGDAVYIYGVWIEYQRKILTA